MPPYMSMAMSILGLNLNQPAASFKMPIWYCYKAPTSNLINLLFTYQNDAYQVNYQAIQGIFLYVSKNSGKNHVLGIHIQQQQPLILIMQ